MRPMKKVFLAREWPSGKEILKDEDGIKFEKKEPLAVVMVRSSAANDHPDSRLDLKKDFQEALKNHPETNAFRNAGSVDTETKRYDHLDGEFSVSYYIVFEVEFYHLGE